MCIIIAIINIVYDVILSKINTGGIEISKYIEDIKQTRFYLIDNIPYDSYEKYCKYLEFCDIVLSYIIRLAYFKILFFDFYEEILKKMSEDERFIFKFINSGNLEKQLTTPKILLQQYNRIDTTNDKNIEIQRDDALKYIFHNVSIDNPNNTIIFRLYCNLRGKTGLLDGILRYSKDITPFERNKYCFEYAKLKERLEIVCEYITDYQI